jgi:hypothetical protein
MPLFLLVLFCRGGSWSRVIDLLIVADLLALLAVVLMIIVAALIDIILHTAAAADSMTAVRAEFRSPPN